MAREATVQINDVQQTAIERTIETLNAQIAAQNQGIEAAKALALAQGVPYTGPEPSALKTFEGLVQEYFDASVENDIRTNVREMANEMANVFMRSDPSTRDLMLEDWAKYVKPAQPNDPPALLNAHRVLRRRT